MFSVLNIFKSKEEKIVNADTIIADELMEDNKLTRVDCVDYDTFPNPLMHKGKSDLVLLTLDDITESDFLFNIDFQEIYNITRFDPQEVFTTVKCLGPEAGFIAHKYLLDAYKIDYAVLDITLGYSIKLNNGSYIEYDGVDIALEIMEKFPNAKIAFCSAHAMNRDNNMINKFIDKFEKTTGMNIDKHYINKNGDRVSFFIDFFGIEKPQEL